MIMKHDFLEFLIQISAKTSISTVDVQVSGWSSEIGSMLVSDMFRASAGRAVFWLDPGSTQHFHFCRDFETSLITLRTSEYGTDEADCQI